jgi:hypothetical protein
MNEDRYKKRRDRRVSLSLEDYEHIEFIFCTYSNKGLHEIHIGTNADNRLSIRCDLGPGTWRRLVDLKNDNKAIIGFRGLFAAPTGEDGSEAAILDLYIYVAVRLD